MARKRTGFGGLLWPAMNALFRHLSPHPLPLGARHAPSDPLASKHVQTRSPPRARARRVLVSRVSVCSRLLSSSTVLAPLFAQRWTSATRTEQRSLLSAPATRTMPPTSSPSAARTRSRSSSLYVPLATFRPARTPHPCPVRPLLQVHRKLPHWLQDNRHRLVLPRQLPLPNRRLVNRVRSPSPFRPLFHCT